MEITLDNDMLKSVVSEAILKSIDDQKRDALVQAAIRHLLTSAQPTSYNRNPSSPIQDAFEHGMRNVAVGVCRDILEKDESVREKLRGLVADAVTRLMDTNREKTVEKLADAIAAGMAYRERD